jgi:hypothetical protein
MRARLCHKPYYFQGKVKKLLHYHFAMQQGFAVQASPMQCQWISLDVLIFALGAAGHTPLMR